MPQGEGSPRIRHWSAESLEGRLLLTHPASSAVVHILSTPTTQVSTPSTATRPESEPVRSITETSGDVAGRDADEIAAAAQAASTVAKDQYTIPLILSSQLKRGSDDSGSNGSGILTASRYLRVASTEEIVAWGSVSGASSGPNVVRMARNCSEVSLEISDSIGMVRIDQVSAEPSAAQEQPELMLGFPAPVAADLLAPFLPVDRAAIERAIDRLMDGIEILGDEIGRDGEVASLIPLPIAWGIGLAAVELIRRRLRRQAEEDPSTDRDPALGLLGSTA